MGRSCVRAKRVDSVGGAHSSCCGVLAAAIGKDVEVVELLLEHGATANVVEGKLEEESSTHSNSGLESRMDNSPTYWFGYLVAFAIVWAFIAALIGGHLPKQNVIKWAIGGMLLGIAIGVYTMTDMEDYDPEVAAKDFHDGCVEGLPKEYADFASAYCSCMTEKFRTNEQGFADLARSAHEQNTLAEMATNPAVVELQLQCRAEVGLTPRK